MPKVSIIVPVYKVEKYLDRCVKSLVNQTLKDIEIILVDDESPDNCPKMCDEYAEKDSRIKVLHKKNGGLGFARNSGLDIATGEYVTFCDSDDYVELETYETMYNNAKEKELDICYFKYRRFFEGGGTKEVCFDKKEYYFYGRNRVDEFLLNMVGKDPEKTQSIRFSMSVCMGIFKLSSILNSNIRFVSERTVASEDLLFHLKFLPYVNRIGVLPNVFYNYYVTPGSISNSFDEGKYQRMMKLLEVVKEELMSNYSWEIVKNHYYSQQLRIIKIILRNESISKNTMSEKISRIKRHCEEQIFKEIYNDSSIRYYSSIDQMIVLLMKRKFVLPILLIYKYICK